MNVTIMICSTSYLRVIKDISKQPSNHVAWQVEDYLKSKNIK